MITISSPFYALCLTIFDEACIFVFFCSHSPLHISFYNVIETVVRYHLWRVGIFSGGKVFREGQSFKIKFLTRGLKRVLKTKAKLLNVTMY